MLAEKVVEELSSKGTVRGGGDIVRVNVIARHGQCTVQVVDYW